MVVSWGGGDVVAKNGGDLLLFSNSSFCVLDIVSSCEMRSNSCRILSRESETLAGEWAETGPACGGPCGCKLRC